MRKVDQYRRRMEFCLASAAKAPFGELRAVWQSLGDSYAVLAEMESWQGFGFGEPDGGQQPTPSAQFFNVRSTDDRILP